MLYNLHTHSASNNHDVFEVVNRYPYEVIDVPYFSTGIHPWHIDIDRADEHLAIIEQRLQLLNCLALGECGLDKRIDIPLNIQIEVFEKQLLLAKKYQKPVILHLVAAFQELIEIKNRLQPGVPMIVHGYSKNAQVAKQLLDNGFYLSFGKYLLRNPELSAVFAGVPKDCFFLETDTIEEGIAEVYAKAALARNMDIEVLKSIVQNNFKNIFKNG
ncbi:TatD family hydrolase [Flavobacterium subsaxonicum]|uniref:Hydrolase TatD n=1 Tax=Flavobacterium subsaxonicum WB 4.1-42 = DSM 21790 TaxID=1121898 RepID=A0A0A2MNJ2_9FLAO|nr:TatD family hydrolase [Flavobacterium subsaxonicum]KGO93038.1 hydrolase TatD [Flavobacterium subsaxonicum WB 4.1-42 = DSM 21790]